MTLQMLESKQLKTIKIPTSGGHGARTRNRFPGTTFPVWPLTIRLPSGNRYSILIYNFLDRKPNPEIQPPYSQSQPTAVAASFGFAVIIASSLVAAPRPMPGSTWLYVSIVMLICEWPIRS